MESRLGSGGLCASDPKRYFDYEDAGPTSSDAGNTLGWSEEALSRQPSEISASLVELREANTPREPH